MIENDKVKLTAIVLGITIFFAYIKQYLYYKYFNIDISDYISINEVFTPFIDDIAFYILFMIGLIAIGIGLANLLIMYVTNKQTNTDINSKENKHVEQSKVIKKLNNRYLYSLITMILLICFAYKLYIEYDNYLYWFAVTPMIMCNFIIDIFTIFKMKIVEFKSKNPDTFQTYQLTFLLATICLVTTSFFSFIAIDEIDNKLKTEHKEKTYIFLLPNNEKITTGATKIYLGRTDKNIFIYNRNMDDCNPKHRRVDIINKSDIIREHIIELKHE